MNKNVLGQNFYALQVKTREEEKFMRLFRGLNPNIAVMMHFPQRVLDIRKMGKTKPSRLPVFPGYIFLELDSDDSVYRYQMAFRKTDGFYRFLRSNRDIAPLQNRDLELVLHFIKRIGPVAGKSKVYFDDNSRIVVLHGPLSGLEGKIVKVDRRKKRAKVVLDLYNEAFSIDLAFEVIEKIKNAS